jgi:hypothetical protein
MRDRPLMMISSNMASGFPLTTYLDAQWPQRYSNLWPLVAAYDSGLKAPPPFRYRSIGEMTRLERSLLETIAEDFVRSRPPLVAVLRPGPDAPKWWMRRLDLLAFLRQEPRFAQHFDRYVPAGVVGQYELYQAPEAPRIVIPPDHGPQPAPQAEPPGQIRIERQGLLAALLFLALLGTLYVAERRRLPLAPGRVPGLSQSRTASDHV